MTFRIYHAGAMRDYQEGAYCQLGHLIDFRDPVLQRWELEIDSYHRHVLPFCFIGLDDTRGFTVDSTAEEVLAHLESRQPRSREKDALVTQLRRLLYLGRRPRTGAPTEQRSLFEAQP